MPRRWRNEATPCTWSRRRGNQSRSPTSLNYLCPGRGGRRTLNQSRHTLMVLPYPTMCSNRQPVVDDDLPDADVVLATFWRTGSWVAALSPRKGAKAILLQGYETTPGREDPAMDLVWRLPLRKIVLSKWLVDLARDRFEDSDVHHVPNSVDTDQFYSQPRGRQPKPTVGILYATIPLKGSRCQLGGSGDRQKAARGSARHSFRIAADFCGAAATGVGRVSLSPTPR